MGNIPICFLYYNVRNHQHEDSQCSCQQIAVLQNVSGTEEVGHHLILGRGGFGDFGTCTGIHVVPEECICDEIVVALLLSVLDELLFDETGFLA